MSHLRGERPPQEKEIYQYSIVRDGIGDVVNIRADSLEEAQSIARSDLESRRAESPQSTFEITDAVKYPYKDVPPIRRR